MSFKKVTAIVSAFILIFNLVSCTFCIAEETLPKQKTEYTVFDSQSISTRDKFVIAGLAGVSLILTILHWCYPISYEEWLALNDPEWYAHYMQQKQLLNARIF